MKENGGERKREIRPREMRERREESGEGFGECGICVTSGAKASVLTSLLTRKVLVEVVMTSLSLVVV